MCDDAFSRRYTKFGDAVDGYSLLFGLFMLFDTFFIYDEQEMLLSSGFMCFSFPLIASKILPNSITP